MNQGKGGLSRVQTEESPCKILLIEDNDDFASLLKMRLELGSCEPLTVKRVDRLMAGLTILSREAFDLVLLDLVLPDSKGFDTLRKICGQASGVPIVVLSGVDDETLAVQAIREGAQDYIVKGDMVGENILRSVRYAVERHRILQEWKTAWQTESLLALHDPLTGIPNRLLFQDRLKHGISQAHRHQTGLAVLFLDLDRFKPVNDRLGHAAGDHLLTAVAGRLKSCVREEDTIARLGGDEFGIILPGIHEGKDAAVVAQRIRDKMSLPFELEGHRLVVSVSAGIALYPPDGSDADRLIQRADRAMYRAKADGGNCHRFFELQSNIRMLS